MTTALDYTVQEMLQEPDALLTELAARKFRHFIPQAWSVIIPNKVFVPNWHIDAICDHLQAVKDREIKNLLVNMPTRMGKTLTISVLWHPWCWIDSPEMQFLGSSYAKDIAIRDAVDSRNLIQSEWYQARWGNRYKINSDQNAKQRYQNNQFGHRIATSVGGSATGDGGDIVMCDDPHNVEQAESDAVRGAALLWWDEVMSTRLNDQKTGGKVIVMQRCHEHDLSGHLLEKGGWTHLMLPMEFNPKRKCFTEIGFEDPRKEEGELLSPKRVGPKENTELKRDLGSFAYAAQQNQSPSARGGNLFMIDNLNYVTEIPEIMVKKRWRAWDKAATEGAGAYTVGLRMGKYTKPRPNGTYFEDTGEERVSRYFIDDVVRGQWSTGKREEIIKNTSKKDGKAVWIVIEQEPGSGGKDSATATKDRLVNRHVELERPTGDKEERADDFSVAVENGEVDILLAHWTPELKNELEHFPNSTYKDQTDCCAMAHKRLAVKGRVHIG
jgi:predicted phage terminase large subunit-like protein